MLGQFLRSYLLGKEADYPICPENTIPCLGSHSCDYKSILSVQASVMQRESYLTVTSSHQTSAEHLFKYMSTLTSDLVPDIKPYISVYP